MRLIHYSREPLTKVEYVKYNSDKVWHAYKPQGLWFSVEGDDDWLEWCKRNEFGFSRLKCATEIVLADDANILILSTAADLDRFTKEFGKESEFKGIYHEYPDHAPDRIDWAKVQAMYDGIIIAPYIWQRRLELMWYYCWDCASGCIWNAAAIKELRALEPPILPQKVQGRSALVD